MDTVLELENVSVHFDTPDGTVQAVRDVSLSLKSGETLASIAEKRGVTIDTICKLNHITKGKAVRPGQILRYS